MHRARTQRLKITYSGARSVLLLYVFTENFSTDVAEPLKTYAQTHAAHEATRIAGNNK
jgi:hypothetical protein